jgi:NTE family protein
MQETKVAWSGEADGVFRGGGVKGIALAGALEGFAKHPSWPVDTWVNVAGASAGAIIAGYLALGHSAEQMVSLLDKTEFGSFADFPGGRPALGLVNLARRHGMARGQKFERWFDKELDEATFGDLKSDPGAAEKPDWRLKMVAVDVTNRRLLELPNDLSGYRVPGTGKQIDPDAFPVSRAARMSMSIPYFFEPVELEDPAGKVATIIDGGTLSNFPVWIFDVDPDQAKRPPRRPTFGFTLKGGKGVGAGLGVVSKLAPWPLRFGVQIFHTAQDAWDERFVSHSTRVRTLAVDAADVATTDFNLAPKKKRELLDNGLTAAKLFLDEFDPGRYENTYHASIEPETE